MYSCTLCSQHIVSHGVLAASAGESTDIYVHFGDTSAPQISLNNQLGSLRLTYIIILPA
jgi:hypothetical protein